MNRTINQYDIDAIQEGYAIQEHRELSIRPSGRDDAKIRSKNYLLRETMPIATHSRSTIKHSKNGRQIDLKSINVHRRLEIAAQKEKLKKLEKILAKQKTGVIL